MRILIATALLVAGLTLVATPADARSVACTEYTSSSCPGFYCVDDDLDGYLEPAQGECAYAICPSWGCCSSPSCPPPAEW